MIKTLINKIVAISSAIILFFIFLLFAQETKSEEVAVSQKTISEIQISSEDMICDYSLEDPQRKYSNFEYPKLILTENENPLIAFIDEKSEKMIFAEVSDKGVNYLKSIPKYGEYYWEKWPVIFVKNDKVYLALAKETKWHDLKTGVNIFFFDRKTKEIFSEENRAFFHGALQLKGIYPYKNNSYMIIGRGSKSCWNELGTFLTKGHLVTYDKIYSFLLDENGAHDRQIVDEGCFNAYKSVNSVSDSGVFQSTWVRNTTRQSISATHDEIVFYAENKTGNEWGNPLEIYRVEGVGNAIIPPWRIQELYLTNYKQSAFILWVDIQKGYFFAEVKDGKLVEVEKIRNVGYPYSLDEESTIKIASDENGNVYCLLAIKDGAGYQLILKSKINGKWLDDTILSKGTGIARLPDIKVDKKGTIHVTYIKASTPYISTPNVQLEKLTRNDLLKLIKVKATCNYVKVDLNEIIKRK